ncbi:type IV pilus modification protein PilV [Lysobacter claricitrinus]|uniref:type IV pilus modification protein PilV n=1 Tax=Lysobacter claricitrinus TaxID=3367728 RepID=UPI0037DAD736
MTGYREQRGSSLLEVLIAVVILAVGMLGMAALQVVTLRNTGSAAQRSAAIMQSYAMFDLMRANSAAARAGQYNQGWLCQAPAGGTRITNDISTWITQLQGSMGDTACGRIACGSTSCQVSVKWDESRSAGEPAPDPVVTTSRL